MKRLLYRIRFWLFRKIGPRHLAVVVFKGVEKAPGTSLVDLTTMDSWGPVEIKNTKMTQTSIVISPDE